MKYFVLLTVLICNANTANSSTTKAHNSALAAIKAIFPNFSKTNKIQTKTCNFQKEKWAALVLTKESFKEKLKFNKQCDLEGSFIVQMDKFFPADIKMRNLKNYTSLTTKIKLSIVFEDMPVLKIHMKNAILHGPKALSFNMDYAVIVDITNKDPLQKHKGGTLYLKTHGNKALNKKIPLKL